jgi:hypothetical protein
MKSPTLSKINELAEILNIHPLTLLLLAYAPFSDPARVDALLRQIERECRTIDS